LFVILNGDVAQYDNVKSNKIGSSLKPSKVLSYSKTIGDDGMLALCSHHSSYRAMNKSLVLILSKKDLVEVLSNAKAIESGNRQEFLTKCQFLNELSFNRVLEFNNILREQRFYPGDIVYD
jgi:hypothetical protein